MKQEAQVPSKEPRFIEIESVGPEYSAMLSDGYSDIMSRRGFFDNRVRIEGGVSHEEASNCAVNDRGCRIRSGWMGWRFQSCATSCCHLTDP